MRHMFAQLSAYGAQFYENTATTQVYIHADLALKERAIARTAPQNTTPGRYQPPDDILVFLDGL